MPAPARRSGSIRPTPAPPSSPTAALTTGRARTTPSAACFTRATTCCTRSTPAPASSSPRSGPTAASISRTAWAAIRSRCAWCNPPRPGRVFEDLLILGSATNEGYTSGPGDLRAFDVRTGTPGLDLPHHSASRRVRLRDLAARRLEDRRRRQRVGRVLARYRARHRLRPHRQPQVQLLRRRPQGRQPFRRLPAGARRPHRQAHLALPDGPPRYLGLRRCHRAQAPHRAPQRQGRRCCRAAQQAGLRVGLRPRHRPAALAHRGAPRAEVRRPRRGDLAHAALPPQAAALRAPEIHGGRSQPVSRGSAGARPLAKRDSQRPQRRPVYAARAAQHHRDARQQRRRQLGRRGGRSRIAASSSWSRKTFRRS